jgi:hypothetical protein
VRKISIGSIFAGCLVSFGLFISVVGAIKLVQEARDRVPTPDVLARTLGLSTRMRRFEGIGVGLTEFVSGLIVVFFPIHLLSSCLLAGLGCCYVVLITLNWDKPAVGGCGCTGSQRKRNKNSNSRDLVPISSLLRAFSVIVVGFVGIGLTITTNSLDEKFPEIAIGFVIGLAVLLTLSPDVIHFRACERPIFFATGDRLRRTWSSSGFRQLGLQQPIGVRQMPDEHWREGCSDYFVFKTSVEHQVAVFSVTEGRIRSNIVNLPDD